MMNILPASEMTVNYLSGTVTEVAVECHVLLATLGQHPEVRQPGPLVEYHAMAIRRGGQVAKRSATCSPRDRHWGVVTIALVVRSGLSGHNE